MLRCELGWPIEGLICTAYPNKEHLYSKKNPRAVKVHITSILNQGLFYPLMKPPPTPLFDPYITPRLTPDTTPSPTLFERGLCPLP